MHSPDWYAARCGCVTASNAPVLMVDGKTKGIPWGAGAQTYARKLAWQIITGKTRPTYESPIMQRGNDLEPLAIDWYRLATGFDVVHNTMPIPHEVERWIAATPDGIVEGGIGLVQVKCPLEDALIDAWLTDEVPKEYFYQVQFEMWITEAEWCDLLWFDPDFSPMPHGRVIRVDADYDAVARRALAFRDYVLELVETLLSKGSQDVKRKRKSKQA